MASVGVVFFVIEKGHGVCGTTPRLLRIFRVVYTKLSFSPNTPGRYEVQKDKAPSDVRIPLCADCRQRVGWGILRPSFQGLYVFATGR